MFRLLRRSFPSVDLLLNPHQASRTLHSFPIPRPEVVIGNNTAIFATLSSLAKHSADSHPKITFICPSFWLDNIHPDYNTLNWGQTIYGLPKFAREVFRQIYPHYPSDKFITWHEYQELRKAGLDTLKKLPNITLFEGLPEVRVGKSEYRIDIQDFKGNPKIHVPNNTYFYNWFRTHIQHQLSNIIQRSHTELYTIPRNKLPKEVVILGHGLSVVWLEMHFPEISFINIKRENDKPPKVPANSGSNLDRLTLLNINDVIIKTNPSDSGKVLVIDKSEPDRAHIGEFYSAIGIAPVPQITDKVPVKNKQIIPLNYKVEDWVAPKNLPMGSLMESFARWIEVTGNLAWAHEPQAYHSDHFPLLLKENVAAAGIDLPVDFFDLLEDHVRRLENPLNENQSEQLFVSIFRKVLNNASPKEITAFEECLQKMRSDRQFDIPNLTNHSPFSKKL